MLLLTIITAMPLHTNVISMYKPQLIAANWGMFSGRCKQAALRENVQQAKVI